ncbi:hypothetical protein [Streptomyces sp. NBC_00568]|uniref:hypothetical protein n=1 Tax=Streptomyces sp. NBC_00568 TaxID=2975779 RepID=UPI00224FD821|nr:hypothetical protein [Streptomyces sp. NBC_00568]MCX4993435.1 hypothetical protein [Streptomyces sp. NBC_00568]
MAAEPGLLPVLQVAAADEVEEVAGADELSGMTPEVFRRIARAEGVERKREPTVGREVEAKRSGGPVA